MEKKKEKRSVNGKEKRSVKGKEKNRKGGGKGVGGDRDEKRKRKQQK